MRLLNKFRIVLEKRIADLEHFIASQPSFYLHVEDRGQSQIRLNTLKEMLEVIKHIEEEDNIDPKDVE